MRVNSISSILQTSTVITGIEDMHVGGIGNTNEKYAVNSGSDLECNS